MNVISTGIYAYYPDGEVHEIERDGDFYVAPAVENGIQVFPSHQAETMPRMISKLEAHSIICLPEVGPGYRIFLGACPPGRYLTKLIPCNSRGDAISLIEQLSKPEGRIFVIVAEVNYFHEYDAGVLNAWR